MKYKVTDPPIKYYTSHMNSKRYAKEIWIVDCRLSYASYKNNNLHEVIEWAQNYPRTIELYHRKYGLTMVITRQSEYMEFVMRWR